MLRQQASLIPFASWPKSLLAYENTYYLKLLAQAQRAPRAISGRTSAVQIAFPDTSPSNDEKFHSINQVARTQ